MADPKTLTFIKRSSLPAVSAMRVSTPGIVIANNGQIRISTALATIWGEKKLLAISFDTDSRTLGIRPLLAVPKGWSAEDLFELQNSKNNTYFSGAGVLKHIGYDYVASGHQRFELTPDAKTGEVSFTLPEKLTPLPVKPRKAKKVVKGEGVKAEAGSTEVVANDEDDLGL